MAIETSSPKYTDNFRKMRRYLQGRGVNLRVTIVPGPGPYSDTRITVPGLHSDDAIISVLDLSDLSDATGYLDDGGEFATLDVYSTTKGITFTAKKAGAAGNKIYIKAAADPAVSAPLSVEVGAYDEVLGTTGNPGKTAILVNLATDSSGIALSTSANSAANVLEAILLNQEASKIVDGVLDGNGSTAWTALSATPLAGGADFDQGPSRASLTTSLDYLSQNDDNELKFIAQRTGADGNDITVTYTAGGALAVGVSNTDITVTYVPGVTTAKDVMDAVNANADAAALVLAVPAPGNPTGAGVVATMGQENLSGGVDPGIQLNVVAAANKKLLVMWLTKEQMDEN